MKLVKIVGLAVILSIIVYYMPSFFIGFSVSTIGIERKTLAPTIVDTRTDVGTLRFFADNSTQNTVAGSTLEKGSVQDGAMGKPIQIFISNIFISMITAMMAYTIVRRIYR